MKKNKSKGWWQVLTSHIRIPKELWDNPLYQNLSVMAILLYGFLVDLTSLSAQNGAQWCNEHGEVFVRCSIDQIMMRCRCKRDKARAVVKELLEAGLIRRYKEEGDKSYRYVVIPSQHWAEKSAYDVRKNQDGEGDKTVPNNTLENHPNDNHLHMNKDRREVMDLIRMNVNYDQLCTEIGADRVDAIIAYAVDAACRTTGITVSGIDRTAEEVTEKMLSLTDRHVRFVIDRIRNERNEIRSIRAYVLARLFDADASFCLTGNMESGLGYSDDEDIRAAVLNMMRGDLL